MTNLNNTAVTAEDIAADFVAAESITSNRDRNVRLAAAAKDFAAIGGAATLLHIASRGDTKLKQNRISALRVSLRRASLDKATGQYLTVVMDKSNKAAVAYTVVTKVHKAATPDERREIEKAITLLRAHGYEVDASAVPESERATNAAPPA